VLPFVGLDATYVAVDAAGTVYVRGKDHKRVLLLHSGSTTQSELPLTGIKGIEGLAVDSEGTVYIADFDGAQVVAFAASSDTPSVLPITGLRHPSDVAVDATGNVYVSGYGFSDERLVLKLPVALPA
jgi:DNA-binding beta-propeller fold protein YncE